jgi:hypothetical protein
VVVDQEAAFLGEGNTLAVVPLLDTVVVVLDYTEKAPAVPRQTTAVWDKADQVVKMRHWEIEALVILLVKVATTVVVVVCGVKFTDQMHLAARAETEQ